MTTDDIESLVARLRERHFQRQNGTCNVCGTSWACDVRLLLDEVERLSGEPRAVPAVLHQQYVRLSDDRDQWREKAERLERDLHEHVCIVPTLLADKTAAEKRAERYREALIIVQNVGDRAAVQVADAALAAADSASEETR